MSSQSHVKCTQSDRVARLTLARPPLNVLHIDMIAEMNGHLEELSKRRDLCALKIEAEGPHFCAGVDVSEHRADTIHRMLQTFHQLFRLLHRFPCPIVAAVQGSAFGGGMELACFCDITVASSSLRIGVPEITLGVFPPVAMAHLHRLVGTAKAAELIFTGATVDAQEALRIGLISRVCEDAELAGVTDDIAARWAHQSAYALRLARRAFHQAAMPDFEHTLARAEAMYLEELMKGQDPTEGLTAFMEKRKPQWTHQ